MSERPRARPGLDRIWDAVPWDEIVSLATKRAEKCGASTEEAIKECARAVVRSKLCFCVSDEELVVAVIVEEFLGSAARKGSRS